MKTISRIVFVVAGFSLLSLQAMAGEVTDYVSYSSAKPPDILRPADKDKDLANKYSDFENFAKLKVQQFNRNLRFSRSRMKITRKSDGTYSARYHQIEDSTLTFKVRRSQSRSIPYVGVLSYRELVFESSAATPEQFDQSLFAVVEVIPNRHIFSYRKGKWD